MSGCPSRGLSVEVDGGRVDAGARVDRRGAAQQVEVGPGGVLEPRVALHEVASPGLALAAAEAVDQVVVHRDGAGGTGSTTIWNERFWLTMLLRMTTPEPAGSPRDPAAPAASRCRRRCCSRSRRRASGGSRCSSPPLNPTSRSVRDVVVDADVLEEAAHLGGDDEPVLPVCDDVPSTSMSKCACPGVDVDAAGRVWWTSFP